MAVIARLGWRELGDSSPDDAEEEEDLVGVCAFFPLGDLRSFAGDSASPGGRNCPFGLARVGDASAVEEEDLLGVAAFFPLGDSLFAALPSLEEEER